MASQDPYYNRRLKGTKVYNMRHRIVLSVMAAGGLIGVLFHFMGPSQHLSQFILEKSSTDSQFLQEKRLRISHSLMSASSKELKETQKEMNDI